MPQAEIHKMAFAYRSPPIAGGLFYLVAVLMAVGSDSGTLFAKEPSQWLFGGCFGFGPSNIE